MESGIHGCGIRIPQTWSTLLDYLTWGEMCTLNLQREKMKKISEYFLSWPKVELKSFDDFPMLAQIIKKVSKVHRSIRKTKSIFNVLVNGDPIRQSVIWPQERTSWLKKNEIVLIRVHLLPYSGARVQRRFLYAGDLVTRKGDREIRSVSGRVGMYGVCACMWAIL